MVSKLWSEIPDSGGRTETFGRGGSEERTGAGTRIKSRVWPDVWVGPLTRDRSPCDLSRHRNLDG